MSNTPVLSGDSASLPSEKYDQQFMAQFQEIIQSWADATNSGNKTEADKAAMQALLMAADESLKNPTPSLTLKGEAEELEYQGEWHKAELARRKVLELEQSSGSFGLIAKAECDLSLLLSAVGRLDESWQFACDAVNSARRANLYPLLVSALNLKVRCALTRGQIEEAFHATSEALAALEPEKLTDNLRASILINRACCLIASGRVDVAEADLVASRRLLPAETETFVLPGPNKSLASWWEVKSEIDQLRGNLYDAIDAIDKAIARRGKSAGPFGRIALARDFNRLGEISKLAGNNAASELAFAEARAIRSSLRLPSGSI